MNHKTFLQRVKPAFYYLLAAFFLLFEMGVQSSPNVIATQLMSELKVGSAALGTAVGFYFFSYTFMQIPVGLMFDRLSAKLILIVATFTCAVGAYWFSVGEHLWVLGVARFLMGFGSAFAFVGVLVIANDWFLPKYFALLVGVAQLLAAVGAAIGSVLLSSWVHAVGWREMYFTFAVMGGVLSVLMLIFLRQHHSRSSADHTGFHLSQALQSLKNIAHHRQARWIVVYAFTAWAPITIFPELWGTAYLKLKVGASASDVSYFIYFIWGALAVTSPFYGWLSDRIHKRAVILQWSSVIGLLGVGLMLYLPMHSTEFIVLSMLSMGVAAAGQILTFALIRDNFPKQDLAVAIGIVNMGVVMGGMLFQPLSGFILQWVSHLSQIKLHHSSLIGYQCALSIIPLCYIIGFVVSRFKIKDVPNPADL